MPPSFEVLVGYTLAADALAGRVILISGAAGGIGCALAVACARSGASLVLLDCNRSGLESVRHACVAAGARAPETVVLDLARATTQDYRAIAEQIAQRHGRLDGLVNNAGWIGALTPFEHVEPQMWAEVVTVNLAAPFFLTQWCMPLLKAASDPVLIFSLHATARAYWSAYASAKAGLEGLMHSLADEYHAKSSHPIRVFGIDTGPVATAQRQQHYPGERPDAHPSPQHVIGPYLYALGPDARHRSDVILTRDAGAA